MSVEEVFNVSALNAFNAEYDGAQGDSASHARGEFLQAFPVDRLKRLTLNEYAIGLGVDTFCRYVEVRTHNWASIGGTPAWKFGIFFGRTKADPSKRFRAAKRFGGSADEAFASVKRALLDLVKEGRKEQLNFKAIDDNPLSQMFKAKILSLYFPERFTSVCSERSLRILADKLGLPQGLPVSEIQHRLLEVKRSALVVRDWDAVKFMLYLFRVVLREPEGKGDITAPKKVAHRRVDFTAIRDERERIGKLAEEFALKWECERLLGTGLAAFAKKVQDVRDRPGHGCDFLSFSSATEKRLIEVKSVRKIGGAYRFFLSANEHETSQSHQCNDNYYFYLVFFDGKGNPERVETQLAKSVYRVAKLLPVGHEVWFGWDAERRKAKAASVSARM